MTITADVADRRQEAARADTRVRRQQLYTEAVELIELRHPEPLDVSDVARAVFASRRQLQRVSPRSERRPSAR